MHSMHQTGKEEQSQTGEDESSPRPPCVSSSHVVLIFTRIDLDLTTGISIKMIIDEQDHKFTINEKEKKEFGEHQHLPTNRSSHAAECERKAKEKEEIVDRRRNS